MVALRSFAACVLLLAVLLLPWSGSQGTLLHSGMQLYSWAEMLWERSPELGLERALTSVVSGAQPCSRCESLSVAREQLLEHGGQAGSGQYPLPAPAPTSMESMALVFLLSGSEASSELAALALQGGRLQFVEYGLAAACAHGAPALPPPEGKLV